MSNDWLRLWHDMPNDPKWRSIARASGKPIPAVISVYVHMLVCASNAIERGRTQGWCDEDVANALDLTTDDVNAIREAMQGRVLEGDYLKGWEKRQPKRDDGGAERAKAWRERKKLEEERERTQSNAEERPEEDTDTDLSSEGKPSSDKRARKKFKLDELSLDHNAAWLAEKRSQGKYLQHDEAFILEYFKNYCISKGKKYADYLAGYRNAFEWDSCQPNRSAARSGAGGGAARSKTSESLAALYAAGNRAGASGPVEPDEVRGDDLDLRFPPG